MFYFVKTPWWVRKMYGAYTWKISGTEKVLYLTFDDGPHIDITPFVLDELKRYNAKATFFCIGKNVAAHTSIYQRILDEGHAVGNHTYNHLNGWKTNDEQYINDIAAASKYIDSTIFRPPYGRITAFQAQLLAERFNMKTVMWDVLSGDFDTTLSAETCTLNVMKKSTEGSIVVFHDSEKAWERLHVALPKVLAHFSNLGFSFKALKFD
jgi:peptidoglycan/xylan/chitin deacetylase (PgdA/CDA1 family)